MTTVIDRTKYEPIIQNALSNGRIIDTTNMPLIDWLILRNLIGVGGSDIAAALGVNPYKSAYQLWKEKVSDEIEPQDSNKFIIWGNALEEPIISVFEKQTGLQVIREKALRIHPVYDNIYVNLDGRYVDPELGDTVLEAKSTVTHVYKSWKTEDEEGEYKQSIPMTYYCQVQGELAVTGFQQAVLVVLLLDQRELRIIPIKRDEEYIQKQNDFLNKWWNSYVMQNEAPPLSPAELDHVAPEPGTFVEANDKIKELVIQTKNMQEEWNAMKKRIDANKDQIKSYIGETAELLMNEDQILATYKWVEKAEYLVKASSYRSLLLKKLKEKK